MTYPGIGEIGPKCENKRDKDHEDVNDIGVLNDSHRIIFGNAHVEEVDGENQNKGREQGRNLCLGHR
jgi:hypothetical protein